MKTTYIYIAIVVLAVGGLLAARHFSDGGGQSRVTKYDSFAQCLGEKGARFYGAYWCPHCAEQKKLFDNSSALPYVECSTPNGEAQTQICIDAGITSYPTWQFADGSQLDGVQQLSALAEKTSCALPS